MRTRAKLQLCADVQRQAERLQRVSPQVRYLPDEDEAGKPGERDRSTTADPDITR